MDTTKEKGPGAPTDATAPGRTLKSVREPQQRSKLLILLFSDYAKLYSDHPASLHVVQIPRCDTVEEERQALEQAEAGLPLLYRHLWDERLLVGSLSTAVPSLAALEQSEGVLFGIRAMDEAVRRSIASKKARAAG